MRFPDYDILMMALPRWDGPYSSTAFSLARALSRYTRVFYVDNPITIKDYFIHRKLANYQRRKKALFQGADFFTTPDHACPNLLAITPRVTLPINWLPDGWLYDSLARVNDAAVSSTLNRLLRIFAVRKYILINSFNPLYGKFISLSVKPLLNVYQCVDDMTQAPYMWKHGPRLEREFIRKADFTVVTSTELVRDKSKYSSDVHLIPNAADVALFNESLKGDLPMPEEIRRIPADKKIITYTGNICHRLDYSLLKKLAFVHNDKVLLMVGPLSGNHCNASGLRTLPNVVFTGKKKIEELPAYLKYSDCCIIPFLCNTFTRSIYPLKINEYLAAGKPVVSTAFSEDIRAFSDVTYVCRGENDFLSAVDEALERDSEAKRCARVEVAAKNSWSARAHQFMDLTATYLERYDRRHERIERNGRRKGSRILYG